MFTTVQNTIKQLQILHIAICMGALIICMLLKYFPSTIKIDTPLFSYIGVGLAIIGILVARLLFQYKCNKANQLTTKLERFVSYRTAFIIQLVLLEFVVIANAVIMYINSSISINFAVALATIGVMVFQKPTLEKINLLVFNNVTKSEQLANNDEV